MKFYGSPKASGKTKACLDWLRANPDGVLIVATEERARRLIEDNDHCGEHNIIPATRAQRLLGRSTGPIGVDNVDDVLRYLFGQNVAFGTYRSDGESFLSKKR